MQISVSQAASIAQLIISLKPHAEAMISGDAIAGLSMLASAGSINHALSKVRGHSADQLAAMPLHEWIPFVMDEGQKVMADLAPYITEFVNPTLQAQTKKISELAAEMKVT